MSEHEATRHEENSNPNCKKFYLLYEPVASQGENRSYYTIYSESAKEALTACYSKFLVDVRGVLSLFAMMLPETMTGFFLYSGNRVLHSLPNQTSMSMGLKDQHTGGAIMWAMGMLIDTMWIVLAARDWFENERLLAEAEDE